MSSNPVLRKKKSAEYLEKQREREEATSQATKVEDPYDFSALLDGTEKTIKKLENDLSKLRTGGRFNLEVLENLRVRVERDRTAGVRLGDLAQVLPKGGRSLMILVGEKDVSLVCAVGLM